MLQCTHALFRYQTAWRELLHPLSVKARRSQWLKRDLVEINEAILRQPYYTIKPISRVELTEQAKLREAVVSTGEIGPMPSEVQTDNAIRRVLPRYPESWYTVPPHQASRHQQ